MVGGRKRRRKVGWMVGEEKEKRRGKRVALEISGGLLGRLGSHY
jgi:hypothetical protein